MIGQLKYAFKILDPHFFYILFLSWNRSLYSHDSSRYDFHVWSKGEKTALKSYFSCMSFDLVLSWFMWHFCWQVHTINFLQNGLNGQTLSHIRWALFNADTIIDVVCNHNSWCSLRIIDTTIACIFYSHISQTDM